jgi:hypothetical protein
MVWIGQLNYEKRLKQAELLKKPAYKNTETRQRRAEK